MVCMLERFLRRVFFFNIFQVVQWFLHGCLPVVTGLPIFWLVFRLSLKPGIKTRERVLFFQLVSPVG